MSGENKAPAAPPTPEEAEASKAKAAAEDAKAQAKDAAAKLKLIKVVSTSKQRLDSPFAGWSLAEGANAFEGDIPEAVSIRYAELIADNLITVEIIDGKGNATPWAPPAQPDQAKP